MLLGDCEPATQDWVHVSFWLSALATKTLQKNSKNSSAFYGKAHINPDSVAVSRTIKRFRVRTFSSKTVEKIARPILGRYNALQSLRLLAESPIYCKSCFMPDEGTISRLEIRRQLGITLVPSVVNFRKLRQISIWAFASIIVQIAVAS